MNNVARCKTTPLLEWIEPASGGQFRAPYHLKDWCEMIEACEQGGVRAMCSIPIRHFKTTTTMFGIAWLLARRPWLRIIVMCSDHERANDLGKQIRRTCEQLTPEGVTGIGPVRGDNLITSWKNEAGGGVSTMSAAQSRLGRDVDVLIADDPLDEHGAAIAETRDAVDHALSHYAARAIRDGKIGSVLILMSRWSPDDPIGRRLLRKEETWRYVHHAALDDDGNAFAPDIMSADVLNQMRRALAEQDPSERLWFAQLQNDPRVPGLELFGEPALFAELPAFYGFRNGIGIDMSYSAARTADYFAMVVGRAYGGALFLRHVVRTRADINAIENELRTALEMYGRCPVYSYTSGPEVGAIHYLASRGIPVQAMPARFSKFVRAQRTRVAWNGGKVLLPVNAPWCDGFKRRVMLFRGAESDQDDELDALTSLYDGMIGASIGAPATFGHPRF